MKRTRVGLVLVVLATCGALTGWAFSPWHPDQTPPRSGTSPGGTQGEGIEGTGVISYDPPGPADSFLGNLGNIVGNVFDTRVGNPLETGSVSQIAAYFGGSDATFPYLGVVDLTPFSILSLPGVGGLVPFTFNTVPLAIGVASPPVFGGVLVSSGFGSSADSVGMQNASTQGQGFHAGSLPYGGPVITLGNNNAMVRLAGSIWVVPVELMTFDVE